MSDPINDALFSLLACGSGYEEPGEPNIYEAKVKAALYHYHSIQFERDRLREDNKLLAKKYLRDLGLELQKLGKENDRLVAVMKQISNHSHCQYYLESGEYGKGVADGHRCAAQIAREALEEKP
jgi:hypothetical protein